METAKRRLFFADWFDFRFEQNPKCVLGNQSSGKHIFILMMSLSVTNRGIWSALILARKNVNTLSIFSMSCIYKRQRWEFVLCLFDKSWPFVWTRKSRQKVFVSICDSYAPISHWRQSDLCLFFTRQPFPRYWFQTDTHAKSVLADIGMCPPVIVTDNERAFGVRACGDGCYNGSGDSSPSSIVNTVIGRPKASESCRGVRTPTCKPCTIGFFWPCFNLWILSGW